MVGEEYSNIYTAILESLARAYHDWKAMSQASTPDLKMERHPIKDATFLNLRALESEIYCPTWLDL